MPLIVKPGEVLLIETDPNASPTGDIVYTVKITDGKTGQTVVDKRTLAKSPEPFPLPSSYYDVDVAAAKISGPTRNATVTVKSASSAGDSATKLVDDTPRNFIFIVVQS